MADEVELELGLASLAGHLLAGLIPSGGFTSRSWGTSPRSVVMDLASPSFMGVRGYLVPAGGSPFSQMTIKVLLFLMGSFGLLALIFSVALRLPLSAFWSALLKLFSCLSKTLCSCQMV